MTEQNAHTSERTQADNVVEDRPPISVAIIADASAGTEMLGATIGLLLSNLNAERVFVDLSTDAGSEIAAELERSGTAYIIPDVETNNDHVLLADHAAQVIEMPSPEELSRNENHFIVVLGTEHLVPAEGDDSNDHGTFTPRLADPADSPASALVQKVAERMTKPEGKDVTLRLVMPHQLGSRHDTAGQEAYRIVQQVSVETTTEYPDDDGGDTTEQTPV